MEKEPDAEEGAQPRDTGWWDRPVRILAVLAGYVTVGLWSFRFAGPLSPWIPVWLPAGIGAVVLLVWGNRVWPAVFLGAAVCYLIEFRASFGGGELALIAGIGAVAQVAGSVVSASLIRRWTEWPNDLSSGRKAGAFYLAGGLAGPLVSAVIWAPGWFRAGLYPAGTFSFSLTVLFLAGAIGFCLVSPLLLILVKPMGEMWEGRKARFGVPLAVVFVFAVALLSYVSSSVGRHMHTNFREATGRIAGRIGRELNEVFEALESVRSFWDSSEQVERGEFAIFSRRFLERHRGLMFLGWAPVIDAEKSGELTELVRSGAAADPVPERSRRVASFSIFGGEGGESGPGESLAPVIYLEPLTGGADWFGHDLMANADYRKTLERARSLGSPASTSPVALDEGETRGLVGILWVDRKGGPDLRGEAWLSAKSGAAIAVIDARSIVAGIMKEFSDVPAGVEIADATETATTEEESANGIFSPFILYDDEEMNPRVSMGIGEVYHFIYFANRRWELKFHPGAALIPIMLSWEVPAVQTGVLLVCSLLGLLLLVATGYALRMEREVHERTLKLSDAEEDLRRSNAELEQFAYIASHDLREPLRMVTSFVQLLKRRYGGQMGADADEYIQHAVNGTERMRKLIQGLLEISRIGTKGRPITRVDAGSALKSAIDNLSVAIEESGARIKKGKLPTVRGDRIQLTQLFQNLIGNAIKFKQEGIPEIEISANGDGEFWEFSVKDNGPGIAEEHRERIFQIFQRLEPREGGAEGTGIGLAVCRRIVERHGGEISVHDGESGGADFRFTIPVDGKQKREK